MRSLVTLAAVASLLAGCGNHALLTRAHAGTAVTSATARTAPADPSRVIVRFRPGTGGAAIASLAARHHLAPARWLPALDAAVFAAPAGTDARAGLAGLRGEAAVAYAEPDYLVHLADAPAPPRPFRGLLGLGDPDFGKQWGLAKIEVPRAWTLTRGRPDVVVAVLDTGVDLEHPDLRANLVPGMTCFPEQGGPMDFHGHGTHVSGIVAGVADNGIGIAGVAPNCRIMPVKVMGPKGPDGKIENVVAGLVWAVDHGAKVVNMSLGDEGTSALLRDAIAYAAQKDVLVVAAAGNYEPDKQKTANTMDYPAGYPGVMAVGATDENDQLADFSFWGSWISVVAPGVDIYSSVPCTDSDEDRTRGRYEEDQGTSMASPYVAGVAALVRSQYPALTAPQVKQRIERTAQDLGPAGFDDHYGHGRVDAYRALATP